MRRVDVIIAGGGPSGLSTGLHLLQRNPEWKHRVVLLEKARYPRPKLCGGGLTWYGEQVLRELGLDVEELPHVPLEELKTLLGEKSVSFYGKPVGRVVRRDEFDAWLAGKAQAAGLEVHTGEAITNVTAHEGGVTVETASERYEARALVVADGSKGGLRRMLGIEEPARVARLIEILTPAKDEPSNRLHDERRAIFDFECAPQGLQGYYWDFPCVVGGERRVNRGVYDARIASNMPKADLKKMLRASLEARGLDMDQVELMGHPIRWFHPKATVSLPHVLLVGDAAGVDPLMGEGISFALAYGKVAAATLENAFAREDLRFQDYRQALLRSRFGRSLVQRAAWASLIYRLPYAWVTRLVFAALRLGIRVMPAMRTYAPGSKAGPAPGWGLWREKRR